MHPFLSTYQVKYRAQYSLISNVLSIFPIHTIFSVQYTINPISRIIKKSHSPVNAFTRCHSLSDISHQPSLLLSNLCLVRIRSHLEESKVSTKFWKKLPEENKPRQSTPAQYESSHPPHAVVAKTCHKHISIPISYPQTQLIKLTSAQHSHFP